MFQKQPSFLKFRYKKRIVVLYPDTNVNIFTVRYNVTLPEPTWDEKLKYISKR